MEDHQSGGNQENPRRVEQVIGITSEKLLFRLLLLCFTLISVLNGGHSGHIGRENLSGMGIYQGYVGDIFKKSDVKIGL